MPRTILLTLCFVALVSLPAGAQDVVHLKNGDQVAGRATDGMLAVRVETREGAVSIPWTDIDRIDRESYVRTQYEARAGRLAADDARGHFLLALWCRRRGLSGDMTAELEKVVAIDPDNRAARAALGYEKVDEKWVAGDELLAAKGFVKRGKRWVLKEEAAYEDLLAARKRALSESEEKASDLIRKAADENPRVRKYARAAFSALTWDAVRIPLFRALGNKDPEVRVFAAAELGRIGETEAARPLIRSAILDRKEPVRTAAVQSLRALREPSALFPLVRALRSANATIRMHAAAAIGRFGDIRGIEYLVTRFTQNWGPTQRNNIQVLRQVSYIRDFDVEIAQAAQIGDPIVGTLQEGVILDVRVLGASRTAEVVERRIIRGALRGLSGVDMGDDGDAWAKWWGENKERLLAKASE